MSRTHLRVASRKSALALQQTNWVIAQLQRLQPGLTVEIVPVVTQGDKILDVTLSKIGGKGLFVSEVEACLSRHEADFAVHSLKDMPAALASDLVLGAVPVREDPRDALITRDGRKLADLPQGAKVGTSSLRRVAQLRAIRPDLQLESLRGNIDTRLRKLEDQGLHAIVLAAAGLHRMGWQDRITEYLSSDVCLPAIGQGLLGIECRQDDDDLRDLLEQLQDPAARLQADTERSLLNALNGGCQVPIAGHAWTSGDGTIELHGLVASLDGREILRASMQGRNAVVLGQQVADQLKSMGALRLLETGVSVMEQ